MGVNGETKKSSAEKEFTKAIGRGGGEDRDAVLALSPMLVGEKSPEEMQNRIEKNRRGGDQKMGN